MEKRPAEAAGKQGSAPSRIRALSTHTERHRMDLTAAAIFGGLALVALAIYAGLRHRPTAPPARVVVVPVDSGQDPSAIAAHVGATLDPEPAAKPGRYGPVTVNRDGTWRVDLDSFERAAGVAEKDLTSAKRARRLAATPSFRDAHPEMFANDDQEVPA